MRITKEMMAVKDKWLEKELPGKEATKIGTMGTGYDVFKVEFSSEDNPAITYIVYALFPSIHYLQPRLAVPRRMIGYIQFNGRTDTATVSYSQLHYDYLGIGLGKVLYKIAANDLLKTYQCVQSDVVRSPRAEGVWKSLCRTNPEMVSKVDSFGSIYPSPLRYKIQGPGSLRRRPVRVRSHRRKQQEQ